MSEDARRLVVDSSVVTKWFMTENEADVERALELRAGHELGSCTLAAPSHLILEVLNALRFKGAGSSELAEAARVLLAVGLELAPVESLGERAGTLAAEHDLTVYDAAFVALAERLDAELLTADRRLAACPACRTRLLGS